MPTRRARLGGWVEERNLIMHAVGILLLALLGAVTIMFACRLFGGGTSPESATPVPKPEPQKPQPPPQPGWKITVYDRDDAPKEIFYVVAFRWHTDPTLIITKPGGDVDKRGQRQSYIWAHGKVIAVRLTKEEIGQWEKDGRKMRESVSVVATPTPEVR